ncbi:MAG: peptide-methionine (S)-S-oxide reductase [Candidatus Puniceispirillales bacterium WSBS_2018_MAG_OTU23]
MITSRAILWIKTALLTGAFLGFVGTAQAQTTNTFVYSGGCFWCTEADFEKLPGVSEVISGYTGGSGPTIEYYPNLIGNHREAAQVFYDPDVISFEELVREVYKTIDYEDADGQFCDRGHAYTAAIYVKNDTEAAIAKRLAPATSIVPIEPERRYYPVRAAQQNFYKRNAPRYKAVRKACGRDQRLKKLNG